MNGPVFTGAFLKIIDFSNLHTEDFWFSECIFIVIYFMSCLKLLLIVGGTVIRNGGCQGKCRVLSWTILNIA
jgi:hypothetical protein